MGAALVWTAAAAAALVALPAPAPAQNLAVQQRTLGLGQTFSGRVSRFSEVYLVATVPEDREAWPVVSTRLLPSSLPPSSPLSVSVRLSGGGGQIAWDHSGHHDSNVSEFVCVEGSAEVNLTVVVSTFSLEPLEFSASVGLVRNRVSVSTTEGAAAAVVSRNSRQAWTHRVGEGYEATTLAVHVRSDDRNSCAVVYVVPLDCGAATRAPPRNARSQTMLGQAVIQVRTSGEFSNGFIILAEMASSQRLCGLRAPVADVKAVSVVVEPVNEDVLPGVAAVVTVYVVGCVIISVISYCFEMPLEGKVATMLRKSASQPCCQQQQQVSTIPKGEGDGPTEGEEKEDEVDGPGYSKIRVVESDDDDDSLVKFESLFRQLFDVPDSRARPKIVPTAEVGSVMLEVFETADTVGEAGSGDDDLLGETYRRRVHRSRMHAREIRHGGDEESITLDHLAVKVDAFPHSLGPRNTLYAWILLLMGTFYTLPVIQLILDNQNLSRTTGDQDTCYFNFRCKVSFAYFEDFGHVFSNCSYFIAGLIFLAIVSLRRNRYRKLLEARRRERCRGRRGIPEQYGIFYALGGALLLEGVMSAAYHICPTRINFQFDTTFMYVMAVLLFLKLYQFRHPDVTSKAYVVFTVIGVALSLEVVGYYVDNDAFWGVFILIYLSIVVVFSVHTYYNGVCDRVLNSWRSLFVRVCRDRRPASLKPARWTKFLLMVVVIALNCALAGYFVYRRRPGISRYLLAITIINMAVYVTYYIAMKFYLHLMRKLPNERISGVSVAYFALSAACLLCGCYFFSAELKSSAVSPAASRDLNGPCAVFFFDNHDLWHFLSAAGLFFMFMMVLTLEDDNMETSWEHILVF